jgi:PTS system mannose-specific IIB component
MRLDERLIHGQVATKWSKLLGVDRILVADDTAANNEIIKKSLMMAAPEECRTVITTVDGAIKLCNDPRAAGLKILLIVSSLDNLLRLAKEVRDIKKINIGNYGRIVEKKGNESRKSYTSNLYLYDAEVEILKQVMATGIECVVQTIPDDMPKSLKSIIGA